MGDFMLEDNDGMIYIDKELNDKYLLKQVKNFDYNIWGELLSSKVAEILKIPCLQYRVCTFKGKKGLLYKQFIDNDSTLILGEKIFKDYYDMISFQNIEDFYNFTDMSSKDKKKCIFNSWNQLDSVYSILCSRNDININDVKTMDNFLTKMLLFDLVTMQNNRYYNKWGFIKKQNDVYPCPLFDNSISFGLGVPYISNKVRQFYKDFKNENDNKRKEQIKDILVQIKPKFVCSSDNILNIEKMENDNIYHVFQTLLEYVDTDQLDFIQNFLESVNKINIEDSIHKLEKKNGVSISKSLLFYISNIFTENLTNLNNIFKEYKKKISTKDKNYQI